MVTKYPAPLNQSVQYGGLCVCVWSTVVTIIPLKRYDAHGMKRVKATLFLSAPQVGPEPHPNRLLWPTGRIERPCYRFPSPSFLYYNIIYVFNLCTDTCMLIPADAAPREMQYEYQSSDFFHGSSPDPRPRGSLAQAQMFHNLNQNSLGLGSFQI